MTFDSGDGSGFAGAEVVEPVVQLLSSDAQLMHAPTMGDSGPESGSAHYDMCSVVSGLLPSLCYDAVYNLL